MWSVFAKNLIAPLFAQDMCVTKSYYGCGWANKFISTKYCKNIVSPQIVIDSNWKVSFALSFCNKCEMLNVHTLTLEHVDVIDDVWIFYISFTKTITSSFWHVSYDAFLVKLAFVIRSLPSFHTFVKVFPVLVPYPCLLYTSPSPRD